LRKELEVTRSLTRAHGDEIKLVRLVRGKTFDWDAFLLGRAQFGLLRQRQFGCAPLKLRMRPGPVLSIDGNKLARMAPINR
jgi:hypothetical protein